MHSLRIGGLAIAVTLLSAAAGPSHALSFGYAQAIDRLAISCGHDIGKHYKKVNLGGGRMTQLAQLTIAVQFDFNSARTFAIAPSRIEAVGLGEEQLLKPASPEAGANRRVQLINVGPGR